MELKDIISSGLLELHATGIASEAESAQVLEWRAQYPEVREELDAIEQSMEMYIMSQAIEPSQDLKKIILENLGGETAAPGLSTSPTPVVSMNARWKYMAAASLLLLIGSVVMNMVYYGKYQKAELAVQETREQLLASNQQLDAVTQDMGVVQNKYSQPVSLDGLPAAPDAVAKIFWMKNSGEVYIDPSNLPEAPAGMQYQLWGIVDGKPVNAGLIITTKNENKFRIQKMKGFGKVKVQAFAVTLETTGGNTTPKGEMYVMGKM